MADKEKGSSRENGKILILRLYDKLFSILISHDQIRMIQAQDMTGGGSAYPVGSLYVGRVQNISENIGAAFVEIQKGRTAFLPLAEAKEAILTNRKADGRLKSGDELVVQLVREPVKTKTAGVSTRLSLAGTYVVLEPKQRKRPSENTDGSGSDESGTAGIKVSSKLGSKYHHLYKNLEELQKIAEHFHITIRTNAAGAADVSEVIEEAESLAGQMTHILEIADKRVCFSCLYQGETEYMRFVKNCYQSEYDEIVTDEKEIYEALLSDKQLSSIRIRYYQDDRLPLYKLYSIETRIKELTDKKVWLKSGAYLVIEQTEALVSIDVNTGKYEGGKKKEETYLKINLEAAEAIAAALRARNLSGMILVDFINMKQKEHTEQLMDYMKKLLKNDPVPAYVVDITGLGLMEITRKKKNRPFAEQMRRCTPS